MLDARKCVHTPGDQPESLAPGWVVRDALHIREAREEGEEGEGGGEETLFLCLSIIKILDKTYKDCFA